MNSCTTSCGGEQNSCGLWNNGCTCDGSCMDNCVDGACGAKCQKSCYTDCIKQCIDACRTECKTNCNTSCTSSSCSATGRNIFYYIILNISLKLLGVIIWVEKERFLKNQKV